ncbi:MAG: hypothetical protein IT159_06815 [Bryobacterales bacterium]|nr:hypothetical protein [Bryobacterales bacterium]
MKRRMLLVLLLVALPLAAQEAKNEEKPATAIEQSVSKIFEVRYRDPETLRLLLQLFGARIVASPGLKALAVTGPSAVVDAVGEAIKRFDVPVKNVELTVYILAGGAQEGPQDTIPKELESVARQLRNTFSFGGLRVLDTAVIRSREGRQTSASGAFSTPPGTAYSIALGGLSISGMAKENIVRIDNLRFHAQIPVDPRSGVQPSPPTRSAGFSADVDVREGQKVVVGKANFDESGTALILVVTAKVVE